MADGKERKRKGREGKVGRRRIWRARKAKHGGLEGKGKGRFEGDGLKERESKTWHSTFFHEMNFEKR